MNESRELGKQKEDKFSCLTRISWQKHLHIFNLILKLLKLFPVQGG
jgi:hypothetical protein